LSILRLMINYSFGFLTFSHKQIYVHIILIKLYTEVSTVYMY